MIVEYKFNVDQDDPRSNYDPTGYIKYMKDRAATELGILMMQKLEWTKKLRARGEDEYSVKAVIFNSEAWNEFVRHLRGNIPLGIMAPGLVDDLIEKLEKA